MTIHERRTIRAAYAKWRPYTDPYQYGGAEKMTPIERNVWHDIRSNGLPLYPQFPVGPYFVDFADPVHKIVIEVDGKEFHSTLAQRQHDKEREAFLRRNGWQVYRIEGRQTYADRHEIIRRCQRDCDTEEGQEMCEFHRETFEADCSEGILLKIYARL